jgi:4-amino-4-deoxy-L-arabinose transferase-like glycosyltransferase
MSWNDGEAADEAGRIEPWRLPAWLPFIVITLLAAILFALRLSAPPNLLDQDQERPGAYVLDVIKNGNWLCQRDLSGDITSKPPLYTWLCALATLACGRLSLFTLYLPGALAAWGTAGLVFRFGRTYFGTAAALMGAFASMLTTAGLKEFGLARTDGVFAFTVTAAALLAFRAWNRGGGWTGFWLMAAAATLTKGPLGLVLAGCGLLACCWERRSGTPMAIKGSHLFGFGLFLLLTAGWFLLTYRQFGPALVNKMVGRELIDAAVSEGGHHLPGTLFYRPALYYLGRAAPWSLLAYYGFWRVWRRPGDNARERRFERFLFCWFFVGLILFSIASHQRADLLWPIMPAGALLAGRELNRLARPASAVALMGALIVFAVVAVAGFSFYYFGPRARDPIIRQTLALKHLADEIERQGGGEFPFTQVDAPTGLQIYLNTWHSPVSWERAAELLRGPEPAFVAIKNLAKLEAARKPGDPPVYTLFGASAEQDNGFAKIVGNCPASEATNQFAFCSGSLSVRVRGALLERASEREFWFKAESRPAEIILTNESPAPRKLRCCVLNNGRWTCQERIMAAHEIWSTLLQAPGRF